jgi:hypothetical protein
MSWRRTIWRVAPVVGLVCIVFYIRMLPIAVRSKYVKL